MRLLVANQQLAKAGEPSVRDFNDPAPRTLALCALGAFLAARAHMRDVVAIEHVLACSGSDEAGIGAQVLPGTRADRRPRGHHGIEGGHQLGDVISIGRGHDDRQRDATGVDQQHALAPIFFPGRWGWARPTPGPAVP